jgi:cathepsin A (carboxypeptidase C)
MKALVVVLAIVSLILADIAADKMTKIPGYGEFNTSIYSGYLSTKSDSRKLHYLFVESINGPKNKDPVTLWLNGGPGCSSLLGSYFLKLGFIQEIGPYYLIDGRNYTDGDNLTWNEYSWHNLSNLLFLESPAGVGFSYNLESGYVYNDTNVAQDNLEAVKDFFKNYP